jgi:competence protein ComGC
MYRRHRRFGMTLVELFVVIAIILVLMAISFPLIARTLQQVKETRVGVEIKQLDEACETFKSIFGRYPPSRILLCETMVGYRQAINDHLCQGFFQVSQQNKDGLALLAMESMEYLRSIFPGIDLDAGHDWNGDGVIDNRQYFLQGDEALAFFLGGMRYGRSTDTVGSGRTTGLGFNTDRTNPTKQTSSARLGPFFQFEPERINYLVPDYKGQLNGIPVTIDEVFGYPWTIGTSSGLTVLHPWEMPETMRFFPNYQDAWGTPYLYFVARAGLVDNYVHFYSPYCYRLGFQVSQQYHYHYYLADEGTNAFFSSFLYQSNPKPSGWNAFIPYIHQYVPGVGVSYHQPQRFQIISAGADKQYGSGGYFDLSNPELSRFENYVITPEEGVPIPTHKRANFDNITNINFQRVVPR